MNSKYFWSLVLGFFFFKLWIASTTGLGDDEAYYWDWTREPALNYFDHPPLTAWLIWLSTSLFGDNEFAVRLPAWVCGLVACVTYFRFVRSFFDTSVAQITTILFCIIPIYSLGSILMVPDVPMLCLWILALNKLSQLPLNGSLSFYDWMSLGAIVGLAGLTKFTVVLLIGSVFFYLLFTPHRKALLSLPPWASLGLVGLIFSPILLWNMQNDWVTFLFHFSERHSSSGADLGRFGQFFATQLAFLSPFIYMMALIELPKLMIASSERDKFLFWMAAPTLLLFTVQPIFSDFKPHWTAPGYLTILPAVVGTLGTQMQNSKRVTQFVGALTLAFLIPLNLIFFTQTKFPLLQSFFAQSEKPFKPEWDPTNDLYGWPTAAARAQELRATLSGTAFFAAHRYQLAGPLSFYTGHPAWALSSKRDQYDYFTKPNLSGQSAVMVSTNKYFAAPNESEYFEKCQEHPKLTVFRNQFPAREFFFWTCSGFKGF